MSRGIGLKLEGYPKDIEKFYIILAKEGCHPSATKRILERIKTQGFDLLTVSERLKFDWIRESLESVGVAMTFVEPLKDWYLKYEDGEWTDEIFKNLVDISL